MYVQHEKKCMMQKKDVYAKKLHICSHFKMSTCENKPGGNAIEGAYCKMVNMVTDKLFLQEKLKKHIY